MATPDLPRSVPGVSDESLRLPLLALNPNRFKAPASRSLQSRNSDPQLTKEQRLRQQFEFLRGKNDIVDPLLRQPQHDAYKDNQFYAAPALPRFQPIATPGPSNQQVLPVPVWYQVPGAYTLSPKPLYLRPSDAPHILSQFDDSTGRHQQESHAWLKEAGTPVMQPIHPSPPTAGPNRSPQDHQSSLQNNESCPVNRPWSPNKFVPPRSPVFPELRQKLQREKEKTHLANQSQSSEGNCNNATLPSPEKTMASSKRKSPAASAKKNTRAPKRQAKASSTTWAQNPEAPKRRKQDDNNGTRQATQLPGSSGSQAKPGSRRKVSNPDSSDRSNPVPKTTPKTTATSKNMEGQKVVDVDYIDKTTSKLIDMEDYFKSAKNAFCPETVGKMATNLLGIYLCSNDSYWDQIERLMDG